MAYLHEPVEILEYDEDAFPFRQLVREHLNVYDLSRLGELIETTGVFERENERLRGVENEQLRNRLETSERLERAPPSGDGRVPGRRRASPGGAR